MDSKNGYFCWEFNNSCSNFILNDTYNRKCVRLTVDCIENDLGYIKGNLALACLRCNFTKSNLLSFDEMREIAQKYFKPKWLIYPF